MKLITLEDIRALKPMSINVDVVKQLDPWILEAQEFDLKPILGVSFYLDIIANVAVPKYVDLLNGISYTYQGKQYEHKGIKSCLIYYTYARYLQNVNATSTPFGIVKKMNDFSEHVSEATMTRLINQARAGAYAYQEEFLQYLSWFPQEFPKFENCCTTKKSSLKISKISNQCK